YLLGNQEYHDCHDHEVDDIRQELTPADHDRTESKFCSLPFPTRDQGTDDRHDNVVNQGFHDLVCGHAHDECDCKPNDLVLVEEIHEFFDHTHVLFTYNRENDPRM